MTHRAADDHYQVLGVAPDAGADEVRAAWRFAIEAFHPDRYTSPEQAERAHLMAARVNAAWEVLGDPARRRRYDLSRPSADEPAAHLEVPCPQCLGRCGVPDGGGRPVLVRCPSCRGAFRAYVGATLVGRPHLVWRGLRARHVLVLLDASGAMHEVVSRKLPGELGMVEGETVTVVCTPRRGHARYLIVHGRSTDIGWRVG